jgi:hypothetical protein
MTLFSIPFIHHIGVLRELLLPPPGRACCDLGALSQTSISELLTVVTRPLGTRGSLDKIYRRVFIISLLPAPTSYARLPHSPSPSFSDWPDSLAISLIRCTLSSHPTIAASSTLKMKVIQLAALFGGTALAVQPLAAPRKSISS